LQNYVDVKPLRSQSPGGVVRFAVGTPTGRRSSIYRLWTSKNSVDAYLAVRVVAGTQKISFHMKTGSWSHSFVSAEKARPYVGASGTRHIDIWRRPPDFAPGVTRAYTIIVPGTELRDPPREMPGDGGNVVYVPPPVTGGMIHFDLLLASPDSPTRIVCDEGVLVARLQLVDRGALALIARQVRRNRKAWKWLASQREALLSATIADQAVLSTIREAGTPVAGLYATEPDGTRCQVELALSPPTPGWGPICESAVTPADYSDVRPPRFLT
jgi:hypothetical protein